MNSTVGFLQGVQQEQSSTMCPWMLLHSW